MTLSDVGLLQRLDRRVERQDHVVDDPTDADAVHIVPGVERVAFDVVGRRGEVQAEALEQHHST